MKGNPKSKQQTKDEAKSKSRGEGEQGGGTTVAWAGEGPREITKQGPTGEHLAHQIHLGLEDKGESKLVMHKYPRDGGFPGLDMVNATPACLIVAHAGGMITFIELAHIQ